jgi:hypothetical protein
MWFTHKTILLEVLSVGTATYLLWGRDRYTFRSFKIDVAWVSFDALRLLILTCIYDLTLWAQLKRVYMYMYSFSHFVHCLAKSSTESIRILKLCLQFMDLGSLYFVHVVNTSRSAVHQLYHSKPLWQNIYKVSIPLVSIPHIHRRHLRKRKS